MLDLSHKKLDVYQISLKLIKEVYALTKSLPKEEQYALADQMRRAGISICANIAEGASRISKKEKKRFYEIARSSSVELDSHFEITLMLSYFNQSQLIIIEQYIESIFRILSKMISTLSLTE